MAGNQGLGSDSMSQADKDKIHRMGGEASSTAGTTGTNSIGTTSSRGTTTNKSGGGAIDKDAQKRGGQNSQRS